MAYVRRRGNQLAIVHGFRDPETREVRQEILLTLYSKAEARAALGEDPGNNAHLLEGLLAEQHPGLRPSVFQTIRSAGAISASSRSSVAISSPRSRPLKRRSSSRAAGSRSACRPGVWGATTTGETTHAASKPSSPRSPAPAAMTR